MMLQNKALIRQRPPDHGGILIQDRKQAGGQNNAGFIPFGRMCQRIPQRRKCFPAAGRHIQAQHAAGFLCAVGTAVGNGSPGLLYGGILRELLQLFLQKRKAILPHFPPLLPRPLHGVGGALHKFGGILPVAVHHGRKHHPCQHPIVELDLGIGFFRRQRRIGQGSQLFQKGRDLRRCPVKQFIQLFGIGTL